VLQDPKLFAPLQRRKQCIQDLSEVTALYSGNVEAEHAVVYLEAVRAVLEGAASAVRFAEMPEERQLRRVKHCEDILKRVRAYQAGYTQLPDANVVVGLLSKSLPGPCGAWARR